MSEVDLEEVWRTLDSPTEGVTARTHPDNALVHLAIDSQRRRHLLVRVLGAPVGEVLLSTHGLRAETAELSVGHGPVDAWVDIICLDSSFDATFVSVARDLATEVSAAADTLSAVRRTLETWRWFWGVDASALSGESALGLFGELWFMDRWAPMPRGAAAWNGPTANRHDFVSPNVSVEVKTTRSQGAGPPRHRIANLDQLDDPETGMLYLFSVQAIPDPNAGNTLPLLIERVRQRLRSEPAQLAELDRLLADMGWSPALADMHGVTYRIAAERLYEVGIGFPRLIRSTFQAAGGLPPGVDEVGYSVDLAVCETYLRSSDPNDGASLLSQQW